MKEAELKRAELSYGIKNNVFKNFQENYELVFDFFQKSVKSLNDSSFKFIDEMLKTAWFDYENSNTFGKKYCLISLECAHDKLVQYLKFLN